MITERGAWRGSSGAAVNSQKALVNGQWSMGGCFETELTTLKIMNEEPKSELMAEFERLMDSPEVLRYFQVLSFIQEEEKKIKISAPSLAQYMKFRRQQLGMNQLEYAKHLGWQKGAVKQIENGSRLNMKRAKRLFKDGYSVEILFS